MGARKEVRVSTIEDLAAKLRAMERVSKRQRQAMRVALQAARQGRSEVAAAVLSDGLDGERA